MGIYVAQLLKDKQIKRLWSVLSLYIFYTVLWLQLREMYEWLANFLNDRIKEYLNTYSNNHNYISNHF